MNVMLLMTRLLGRRERAKNDAKAKLMSFAFSFRLSVRKLVPVAINTLCVSSFVVLVGACDTGNEANLRQFLDEHPEFDLGQLLRNCPGYVSAPRPIKRAEAYVAFLTSHMGPFTDVVKPEIKHHARYMNVYSSKINADPATYLKNGKYLVTGWMADGRLSCDPEDSFAKADGIIFIENVEPVGE